MSALPRVAVLIVAVCARIASVLSLKCAQCTSIHTRPCSSGRVEPTDCMGLYQGAQFCVTYSGTIRTGRVVFRDCSYVDMHSICRSQLMENQKTEVCYETCDTDGCNAVSNSCQPFCPVGTIIVSFVILVLMVLR
ncbi:UPAR/Ly6 domain-containing protein bou-like [Haliotis asinina]|uniref:UPAR/Ly6 domain-containing protein bou-like n=1 Tax=Haliotis asinina TaxID=109174 RepID=UPI003531DEF3